jgi:hypothetical protein
VSVSPPIVASVAVTVPIDVPLAEFSFTLKAYTSGANTGGTIGALVTEMSSMPTHSSLPPALVVMIRSSR